MKIEFFDRIAFNPTVMGGRACIRDMHVPVSLILNLISNGMSVEQIIAGYRYPKPKDVKQAIQSAAWLADEAVYDLESRVV